MTATNRRATIPDLREAHCPACAHPMAVPFFDGGDKPLAMIAWPANGDEARAMTRLPLDYLRCLDCGHIYNVSFTYENVPYSEKPNLMFNKGGVWSRFITAIQEEIMSRLPERPTVVEVGYGDGSFLSSLALMRPEGRYVGFDPHGARSGSNLVELRQDFFTPAEHLPSLRPDMIVSRHVLEHMTNPLAFLQKISCVGAAVDLGVQAYFEVPCVDRVLETGRIADFYYEHSSQFTTESFSRMLNQGFSTEVSVGHGYDREVVYGFASLGGSTHALRHASDARVFHEEASRNISRIRMQLENLHASGKRIAVWGGTGKGAAFINHYGVDAERFPVVIDSDREKIGTFVPGTGQEIRSRDWLRNNPVDVMIIPTQWRAFDILDEIDAMGLNFPNVLIEHDGRLVDIRRDAHPYSQAS